MTQHGSTSNRKFSRYDAYVSVRLRRTDLATIALWLTQQGKPSWNKSQLVQEAVALAMIYAVEHGAEPVSSTEGAQRVLSNLGIENLNPSGRGEFAYVRKMQEEGKRESDSTPVEEERAEVPVKKKKFEDLDPEMQQAAIDGGYRPDLGRYETIEERDRKMKESFDVSLEQLRKQGTLVEPENNKQD